jgi:NAD(P)-dependent dehydrogenase (short-subunit alcohol dehydrogenase family)
MGLLPERVVLVSGGTQGVGAAIARAAAREGAAVVVSGRRPEPGEKLAAELRDEGAEAHFVAADVADVASAQASVAATVERFGRIDSLVSAAGLTSRGTLLDTTPELFDQHVAVNLRGPFFLMQAAVKDMVRRGAPGTIVNIITMSEHGGQPYLAPYVAAKAGLAGLTRNAAHAHRFDRIRINGSTSAGPTPTARTRPSAGSTAPPTAGGNARPRSCRWASWGRRTRSPTSWCSCCPTAAAWSPVR